jgi:hypothetical protein
VIAKTTPRARPPAVHAGAALAHALRSRVGTAAGHGIVTPALSQIAGAASGGVIYLKQTAIGEELYF